MFKRFSIFSIFLSLFFIGCQTSIPMNPGIQPGFEAVNPAAIIAVPIFILPDPSSEFSSIDPSILSAEKIISSLESKIIESFNHQPNINGYPFSVVKKAVGATYPTTWDNLNTAMKSVASRFSSRDVKTRLLISPNCLARKNFPEFYSYCLSRDSQWLSGLNILSAQVLNADSALISVVFDLENKLVDKQYLITIGFASLLVDTNNGKLIWGNYKKETLVNPVDKKYFPAWEDLLNKVLAPDFWEGFPGRIAKNELNIKNPDEVN